MRLIVLGSPLRVGRIRGFGLRGFGGLGHPGRSLQTHSTCVIYITLEKQLYLQTHWATGRVYDVADASGRLLAPASCTNMCDIDSLRLERHHSVLAGVISGTESQKVPAAVDRLKPSSWCAESTWQSFRMSRLR